MSKIRRVLYPTDFSEPSRAALPHALAFVELFGAELHLLHVLELYAADASDPAWGLPALEGAYEELQERAESRIRATVEEHETRDPKIVPVQERGVSAPPTIVTYAEEHEVDLIVMGTHGRRGVRRALLGSATEEVVRSAPCPVVTVRGGESGPVAGELSTILVPVDFSTHSERALGATGELARLSGARVLVLHVVEELVYPDAYFADAAAERSLEQAVREHVPDELDRTADRVLRPGVEVEAHIELGRPEAAIVEFAREEKVDLVVIASRGLGGVQRALLGSVTERVVRSAPCPVWTMRGAEGGS